MLNLLYGVAGCGKTKTILEKVKQNVNEKKMTCLIVPEQQMYITEMKLFSELPTSSQQYLKITGMHKLCRDLLSENGCNSTDDLTTGMRLVLYHSLLKDYSEQLKIYSGNAKNDATLCAKMLSTIHDLHANGIGTSEMLEIAERLGDDNETAKKLREIALIDDAYRDKIKAVFDKDPTDMLLRASEILKKNNVYQDYDIFLDSFTGFSFTQFRFLSELLLQCRNFTMTLCLDSPDSIYQHFLSTRQTFHRFESFAKEHNVPVNRIEISCADSDQQAYAIRALESEIWDFKINEQNVIPLTDEQKNAVVLSSSVNVYEEAESAAVEILTCVNKGMQFSDIAVFVRNEEQYEGVLEEVFTQHHIPFFISEHTEITTRPLFRFVLSAFKCITYHYQLTDVITMLKTGLYGIDYKDISLFEEYCKTWKLSGNRFFDDLWNMNANGLTTEETERSKEIRNTANRVRDTFMKSMKVLDAECKNSTTLREYCENLYRFLNDVDIQTRLNEMATKHIKEGDLREAQEDLRLYNNFLTGLCQLAEHLPDQPTDNTDFYNILLLYFSDNDVASIPDERNAVTVGNASTLRVENVKSAILLGLTQGDFPKSVSDDSLLNSIDKNAIVNCNYTFDSDKDTKTGEELFYFYRAITRPTERLFLSTIQNKTDDTDCKPSLAMLRAEMLLGKKRTYFDARVYYPPIATETIENRQLTTAEKKTSLTLYPTYIKDFLECPYKYYLSHTLRLREQKTSDFNRAQEGLFLHHLYENFIRECLNTKTGTLEPPADTAYLADKITNEYLSSICDFKYLADHNRLLHYLTKLKEKGTFLLNQILEELKNNEYTPVAFEESIGNVNGKFPIPAYCLQLKNGEEIQLKGTIDRIDMKLIDGKQYIRITDYKSGIHAFKLEDVETGKEIQLVLYLFAVCNKNANYKPGGAMYLYPEKKNNVLTVKTSGFELSTQNSDKKPALIQQTEAEIMGLESNMKKIVLEISQRILDGDISKTPSEDSCKYCRMKDLCLEAKKGKR